MTNNVEILEIPNHSKKRKMKKGIKRTIIGIATFLIISGSSFAFLLYGPYPNFRNWLITTAMTTMSHQYLATIFYSEETIDKVLKDNYVDDGGASTKTDQLAFSSYGSSGMFLNKYEKEILTKDKDNNIFKKINITGDGQRGYLVAIYDPSKVKVGTSAYMGTKGQMLTTIAQNNNAVVAMNASGFIDPNYNSNGGIPHGIVIKDGKLVSDQAKAPVGGGLMGFTKDNKFVLNRMSGAEAVQAGIRDAVEFGPFLIVNGKPSFIKGNGGWGDAPRSAIGQRKDGVVLFLVMDGRDYSHGISGSDMVDTTEILLKYGAYNAANLDGGTSSGLVINNTLVNKPVNGSGQNQTRAIPDAWIVTK